MLMNGSGLLLAIFVFLYLGVNAQIKTPEKDSKWVYNYVNAGSRGPILAKYNKDTFLDDKLALVLEESFYQLAFPRRDTPTYVGNIIAIDDSLVSYWNENQWDTLYDFGAEVEESWYYFLFSGEDTLKATVVDKGRDPNLGVFINLEYEYYDKDFNVLESWKDTIYELTLGGSEYIVPWDDVVMKLDGQVGGPLICFSNSQGRYSDGVWTAGGIACTDIIQKLEVTKLSEMKEFSIYPNPSSGKIFLKSSTNKTPKRVSVVDAKGALVYEGKSLDNIGNLSSQVYYVKIKRQDGLAEVHRVVVE